MNDRFLPDGYEVPETPSMYMRLEVGDNKIRIMSQPILGHEYWTEDDEGKHPHRVRKKEDLPKNVNELTNGKAPKHFWAFKVWNYQLNMFQILQITQKTIQTAIRILDKDSDWGNPLNYDIVINRKGKELNTEYSVVPKPKKKLTEELVSTFEYWVCNLEALFDSADPFELLDDNANPFGLLDDERDTRVNPSTLYERARPEKVKSVDVELPF